MQPRALLFAALVTTTAFAAPPGATPVPAPAPPKSLAPHVPATWKAGTAVVKVTPQKLLWMAGYAARKKPAEGKVQELFAKALALQDEQGNKLVFVTLDLIGVPQAMRYAVAERAEKEFKLPAANLVMNASHTHSGPSLRTTPPTEKTTNEPAMPGTTRRSCKRTSATSLARRWRRCSRRVSRGTRPAAASR